MLIQPLTEAIFDRDVRTVNFFNGRLLTAEDLSREQGAGREEHRRLGRAIGSGVAYGLEVVPTPNSDRVREPALTIAPGLAIDRRGQTLALADPIAISLKAPPADSSTTPAPITAFAICEPSDADAYVAGAGLYLLTIGAVEGKEGRAAVSGLGNIEASCNTKYLVPGVRFRLIQLDLPPSDLNQPDLLRNRVAYRCFQGDAPVYDAFYTNLFGPSVGKYGLIDALRPGRLKDCEVPLAIVYLTATDGLVFVDMWAARRRIIAPAADARFPLLTADRRLAEAEAMFMQFQQQIDDIVLDPGSNLGLIAAISRFLFLPPVGLLPVQGTGSIAGFNVNTFFGSATAKDVAMIDSRLLRGLVRDSLAHEPIDLGAGEKIQLYTIWENVQAIAGGKSRQLVLVFASPALAYHGVARFGHAAYYQSRFAPHVI